MRNAFSVIFCSYDRSVKALPFFNMAKATALFLMAFLTSFFSMGQGFPPPSSCTSKDLDMLEVLLQSDRPDMDQLSGRRQLKLTVTNRTGVDRKSFAVWGTLQRYDGRGKLKSNDPLFICVDDATKYTTLTLSGKDSLYYGEDETLVITNIYTAWSSASANENCDYLKLNPSKIAPRCAIKDSIPIYTGINARISNSRANCGNGKGLLRVSPFGGKGPYKIVVNNESGIAQDTLQINDKDSMQLSLPPGNYSISILDAKRNKNTFRRTIDPPLPLQKTSLSITHPDCIMPKGLVKILNKENNATYRLLQNGVIRYDTKDTLFADVESGAYQLVTQNGNCRQSDTVIVRGRPFIPGKPEFSVTHPGCLESRGKVKISRRDSNAVYHLVQNGQIRYSAADSTIDEVEPGAYQLLAKGQQCSNADSLVINVKPPRPDKPEFNAENPSCFAPRGLVKVLNRDRNAAYHLIQNGVIKYYLSDSSTFNEVLTGEYSLVAVRGNCDNMDSVYIKARPFIPGKPEFSVTHPGCLESRGKVKISRRDSNAVYHLVQNGQIRYSAADSTIEEVEPGAYQLLAKGQHCNNSDSLVINVKPPRPDKPEFNAENPSCFAPRGLVKVLNRDRNAAYHLIQNGVIKYYITDSSTFDEVETGSYSLVAVRGNCDNMDSVYIKERPFIPGKPEFSVTHPGCLESRGKVKISKRDSNAVYHLVQNGQIRYSAADSTIEEVEPGAYQLLAKGQHCNNSDSLVINVKPPRPDKPEFNAENPSCFAPRGLVKVLNRDRNAAYHLIQNGVIKYYITDSSTFEEVLTGEYSLVAVRGICENMDSVYIKARPFIPGKPEFSITQPSCLKANGQVRLSKLDNNTLYHLTQNGEIKYSAGDSLLDEVAPGTYQLLAKGQHCNNSDSLVINVKPPRPDKPQFNAENPSCFAPRGLVKVLNRDNNAAYHLVQNGVIKYYITDSSTFNEVLTGEYSLVAVRGNCDNMDSVYIKARPFIPGKPEFSITQPSCLKANGQVRLSKLDNNTLYHLTQNGEIKYSASDSLLDEVAPGTYQLLAKGQHCNNADSLVINVKPPRPDKPQFNVENPSCFAPRGLVKVLNRDNNAAYHLVQNGVIKHYITDSSTFEEVLTGEYSLVAVRGSCDNRDSVYIKARPFIPGKPEFSITQPSCLKVNGQVRLSKLDANTLYHLTQNGEIKYSASDSLLDEVAPGTYQLLAKGQHCNNADSLVINVKPPRPDKPQFNVENPSCFAPRGLVKVLNRDNNAAYHLVQNEVIKYYITDSSTFEEVLTGEYSLVAVRGSCDNRDSVYIKARPFIPGKPEFSITQPSCLKVNGQVRLSTLDANTLYHLTQNGEIKYSASDSLLDEVAPGAYQLLAKGQHCNNSDSLVINVKPPRPDKPQFNVENPSCFAPRGLVKVLNRDRNAAYHLIQNGVIKYYITDSSTFEEVLTGEYSLVAVRGSCDNRDSVYIKARPFIPGKPEFSITQPSCLKANGQVRLSKLDNNTLYHLTQNGEIKYSASDSLLDEVAPGTYQLLAKGQHCNNSDSLVINVKPPRPDKPSFIITQPTCTTATGTVLLSGRDQGALYSLRQSGVTKYTALGNNFNEVVPGTYEIIAVIGSCDHSDSLTVKAQPFIPSKPSFVITHPTCTNNKGYIIVSNKENGVVYTLAQYGQTVYTSDNLATFGDVTPGKYILLAQAAICSSNDSVNVNEQPPTPAAPTLSINPPSFCSATGSVTVSSPTDTNLVFSKDGGVTWQTANEFGALTAGAGGAWEFKVKNNQGCISAGARICEEVPALSMAENLSASNKSMNDTRQTGEGEDPNTGRSGKSVISNEESSAKYLGAAQLTDPTITIKPVPNPFGSKVRFLINSPQTAKGILEIYNMQGQKIKTIYQGFIYEGLNYFDLTLPQSNRSELIYILRMADKSITGRVLQLANFKQ